MGISVMLAEILTAWISSAGYAAVFLGMVLESMVFPVPSEAIMPFAGFAIAQGKFSWLGVIVAATLGSLVGSTISYIIGRYGGRPFIDRWGKYFLLDRGALERAEKYFHTKGGRMIFLCRFIPVVRHVSSLPAGVGKMNFLLFIVLTGLGAGLWNTFLAAVGFSLQNNWAEVLRYGEVIDLLVLGCLLILFVWWIRKKRRATH